ncbi:DinB family protein [Emticicia sp. BO119]|uniref:DinB family protein n=1 Tax=Emticicia sp. BO119 TaxID=2757768 RepID=UPI0015F010FB|nr:DinB family protein [Emticicia sp. BO119]MBA4850312.1 DinB family protein [Emticicia sp. BO119]
MTKPELKEALKECFNSLAKVTENVEEAQFFAPIGEKWSIAENILHLTQSAKGLNQGLSIPKEVLVRQFGKIDRPVYDYEGVVNAYLTILGSGIKASGAFVPTLPENPSKAILVSSFIKHHETLTNYLDEWSEAELDEIAIKHPVLKLMTIREIYYFMHYHIGHHQKAIQKGI